MRRFIESVQTWLDFKRRKIKVWPGAYVYPTAMIGDHVSIGRNAEIGHRVYVGEYTRIGHGVFIPEGVCVGKRCFIGPVTIFTNDNIPPSPKDEWRSTTIEDQASIGAGCVVKPGVTIHRLSVVGCGSVVTKSIPAGEIWAGNPAVKIGEVNIH